MITIKKLLISLIILLSGPTSLFICAMEKEQSAITTQSNKPKKKRRGKRGGSKRTALPFNFDQLDQCNIKKLLKHDEQNKNTQKEYLGRLNQTANLLLLHEKTVKPLQKIGDIIPTIKKVKKLRSLAKDLEVRRNTIWIQNALEKIHSATKNIYDKSGLASMNDLNVSTINLFKESNKLLLKLTDKLNGFSAHGATLQLAEFWGKNDKKSIKAGIQLASNFCESNDGEVKRIGEMATQRFYPKLFMVEFEKFPESLKKFLELAEKEEFSPNKIFEMAAIDPLVSSLLRKLPNFNSLFELTFNLTKSYMNPNYELDFYNSETKIKKLCEQILHLKPKYAVLYKMIIKEIDTTINTITSDTKNRKIKLSLLREFKKQSMPLENPLQLPEKMKARFSPMLCKILEENPLNTNTQLPTSIWNDKENVALNLQKQNNPNNEWLSDIITQRPKKIAPKRKPLPTKPRAKKITSNSHTNTTEKCLDQSKKHQQSELCHEMATSEPNAQQAMHQPIKNSETLYAQRIMRWFDEKTDDLVVQNATENETLYHRFPLIADQYIFNLGIQTAWKNRTVPGQTDTNYSLGGEIIYPNGERKTVVFTCCKDKNGICYHRGFTLKEKNEFFDEYFKDCKWQVDFPPLVTEEQSSLTQEILYHYNSSDKYHVQHEDELHVRIDDPENTVTIILYKPYHDSFENTEN